MYRIPLTKVENENIFSSVFHLKFMKKDDANKGGICLLPLKEHSGES